MTIDHRDPALPAVKCLLVDDRDDNLLTLAALLRQDGVQLLEARNGAEALELLLVHDVALALLDVQMPDMSGFELAELIRGSERTRHVPLIFVTAGDRDQHRQFQGYDTGAVDFLYKPIEPHILQSKAEVFFQLYRQKMQLAQDLRARTETLRVNEMFMAMLGHDLRDPLNAIVMSASMLQRASTDEAVQTTAGRMLASGQRMGRMIEDMLDLARARVGGGITLQREPGDLAQTVHRVVDEQVSAGGGRQIDITTTGDLRGHWDTGRLGQVVANLVGNAVQHGQPDAPIGIALDGGAQQSVTLTIANAGSIPAEILPHVFDPFRSSRRSGARNDGLGLGLYIAQQVVQAHGGSIDVLADQPDRTVFRVQLPRECTAPPSA